jgi:fatty acid-binding protein DegV
MDKPMLLVDSGSDVPDGFLRQNSAELLSARLHLGSGSFLDRLHPGETRDFYAALAVKGPRIGHTEPQTVPEIAQLLESKLSSQPNPIIALLVSSTRSKTVGRVDHAVASLESAMSADGRSRVHVVDSGHLFAGYAVQALDLQDQCERGSDWKSLKRRLLRNTQLTHAYIVPAGVEFIARQRNLRNERSLPFLARLATRFLGLTPILHGFRGKTRVAGQKVGLNRARDLLFGKLIATMERDLLVSPHVAISYGGDLSDVEMMPGYQRLVSACPQHGVTVHLARMSMTNAIHVGPRALSIGFIAHENSDGSVYSQYD